MQYLVDLFVCKTCYLPLYWGSLACSGLKSGVSAIPRREAARELGMARWSGRTEQLDKVALVVTDSPCANFNPLQNTTIYKAPP